MKRRFNLQHVLIVVFLHAYWAANQHLQASAFGVVPIRATHRSNCLVPLYETSNEKEKQDAKNGEEKPYRLTEKRPQGRISSNLFDNDEPDDGLLSIDEWKETRRSLQKPPPPDFFQQAIPSSPLRFSNDNLQATPNSNAAPNLPKKFMPKRSKVSQTDAGTLVIDITPQGITSGTLFNGAFSVAWFSAIVPATAAALSGGLVTALFFVPFWLAGGFVAKQAVVDPFLSYQLQIGEFAYTISSKYGKGPTLRQQEGATDDLQGATVELSAVVNNVPQYQLCLYSSGQPSVINVGVGLPGEELEKVATEINEYLASVRKDVEER